MTEPAAFAFFDRPDARLLADADARLQDLGLVDAAGLTPLGRVAGRLPLEPRAAVALVHGRHLPDLSRLSLILASVADGSADGDIGAIAARQVPERTQQAARQLEAAARAIKLDGYRADSLEGALVAGFHDRVATRRGPDLWQVVGGRRVALAAHGDLVVLLDLDGGRRGEGSLSRGRAHVGLRAETLAESPRRVESRAVVWDPQRERAIGVKRVAFGDLVLDERPEPLRDRDAAAALLVDYARRDLDGLAGRLTTRHAGLLARLNALGRLYPDLELPATASAWVDHLLPALADGHSSMSALIAGLDERFRGALESTLPYDVRSRLARELPEAVTIPSGRNVVLQWVDGEAPILAAKVQELFGWSEGPRLAGGRVACVIHLLDPGGKPLQVTRDLASFWTETWRSVRAEMRSRYPKHHWPEDPLGEVASTRTTARAFRAREDKR